MSDIDQRSGKGVLVAVMVGAAIGAGVALLFAPRSGKETRRWLASRTREVTDRTTSAFKHGRAEVRTERAADARDRSANTQAGTIVAGR